MALSQIQCLDDNHINPRTHESKAEFLYCEEQRLALETLLRDGREAFFKELEARGLRGFLSELELGALLGTVEPYDPGVDVYREDVYREDVYREDVEDESPLSLHYWPELSDISTPELDMGWPDSESYRGVTRTIVHTQPPLEGHTHIKEIIRKMIAQAQKVIAVVMDVFTDVDIFRDLLDASFKRKVSVYILLERDSVPHFVSMCQRANMHAGHLKNLRVRCSGGTELYTHSCTMVRGRMGHRFMFIDGDKAASGSYSFTWTSSRLDRNLITVVTGQAVDGFDRLFRFLYSSSRLVNLQRVATEPEPVPEPLPQPTSVPPPSADLARKLYSPKYALVAAGNANLSPSSSAGNNSPKESQKDTKNEGATKKGRRKQSIQEAPPLHPGLVDLEKAYLIDYLPTWPEPDPSADVIGFINIRDTSKPSPVHLQRSQMFEVSQAIRFSSPFTKQKDTLPEVAKPRNLTPRYEKNAPQPREKKSLETITPKTKNLVEGDKENAKAHSKKPPLHSALNNSHNSTANSNLRSPPLAVPAVTTPTVSTDSPQTVAKLSPQDPTINNNKSAFQNSHPTETNHGPEIIALSDSNSEIKAQKHNSNENSSLTVAIPVTSTSASANYQDTAVHSTMASASPTLTAISTSVSKLNTSSPIAPSPVTSPPIPKPRTVQLVIKDSQSNGQKIPDVSFVKKEYRRGLESAQYNEPLVATVLAPKETEKVPESANKSASKSIPQKGTQDSAVKDCSQEKERSISREEGSVKPGDKTELGAFAEIATVKIEVGKAPTETGVDIDVEIPMKDEVINASKGMIIKKSDILNNYPEESPIRNSTEAVMINQASCKIGQTYIKTTVPQSITYSSLEENIDLNSPIDRSPILKTKSDHMSIIPGDARNIAKIDESVTRTVKHNSRSPLLSPRGTPNKPTHLHLNTVQMTDSSTLEKECRTLLAQRRSPITDGLLNRIPTPDSRRSHTPDFRTPTSDLSDGYGSTTSDEFFECSESPFHESIEQVPFYSLGTFKDNHIAVANSYESYMEQAPMLDRSMSSTETLDVSSKGSLSSILDTLDDEEKMANKSTQGIAEIRKSCSNSELQVSKKPSECNNTLNQSALAEQSLKTNINNEATEVKQVRGESCKEQALIFSKNRTMSSSETLNLCTKGSLTSILDKMNDEEKLTTNSTHRRDEIRKSGDNSYLQVAKDRSESMSPLSHSLVAEKSWNSKLNNDSTEVKRMPARELKSKRVYSRAERPDRRPAGGEKTVFGSSDVETAMPPANKEPEGHKQQMDSAGPVQTRLTQTPRASRAPRPLSATQSTLARPPDQRGERKLSDGNLPSPDCTSSPTPRKLPPRPPAPKAIPGQHSRQPPSSPAKPKPGPTLSLSPPPKPQASFLYTHTQNTQQTRSSPSQQNQVGAIPVRPGLEEEKTAFGVTLSKLYNLKGLKDKMSKLPTQGRKSSSGGGGSAQPRKSTG